MTAKPARTPGLNSTELLLVAHDEWKNREERRHIHPEEHWVAGWLNGIGLTPEYLQDRISIIRKGVQK